MGPPTKNAYQSEQSLKTFVTPSFNNFEHRLVIYHAGRKYKDRLVLILMSKRSLCSRPEWYDLVYRSPLGTISSISDFLIKFLYRTPKSDPFVVTTVGYFLFLIRGPIDYCCTRYVIYAFLHLSAHAAIRSNNSADGSRAAGPERTTEQQKRCGRSPSMETGSKLPPRTGIPTEAAIAREGVV
ncbi:unnamed protein product [Laminaria digitata]